MATFKAVVEPHYKRADGTYNIRIRVTHQRKTKLISTQFYVTAEDMTRSLKIKNDFFINATNDLIREYREICNKAGEQLNYMDVSHVVDLIKGAYRDKNTFELNFIEFGRLEVKKMIALKRLGTAQNYNTALNSLSKFINRETLNINEITASFLQSYVEWLDNLPASSKRAKGGRAASLYLSIIRSLHNKAKAEFNDEDLGIIKIPFSPFVKFKVPRMPITKKRALEVEHIQKIIELPYKQTLGVSKQNFNRFNLAKDVFLLSFGLVGMNSVDLYSCSNISNGRIIYNRTKTKTRRADKAEISIYVEPQMRALFEKYRDKAGERVFNFYQHYSNPNTFNSALNKALKEIGAEIGVEDLEFYAARHSWATIARNEANIDMNTIHVALNHVDEAMKVTDIYIKKDNSIIDKANEAVLNLFDFSEFDVEER